MVVHLVLRFAASHLHFVCVDHNDIIPCIDVRRERSFVLALSRFAISVLRRPSVGLGHRQRTIAGSLFFFCTDSFHVFSLTRARYAHSQTRGLYIAPDPIGFP